MKWIETAITYLFPTILLEGRPWRSMWEEQEKETFTFICKIFFLIASILYMGHYFFYDKIMGLEPIETWFVFRMSMAGISFATFAFYASSFSKTRFHKIPAILASWAFCYSQAMVTTWWDGTPWLYSFLFMIAAVIVVRTSPLNSIILASLIISSQAPLLVSSGVPLSSVVSTGFVSLIILMVIRTSYIADIKNFVLNQENVAAQKQIIELNIEFADRVRAFIPKVIARRLEEHVNQNRLTMIQAAVEVLKARRTNVACLFSDIRGYTQGSKDLEAFVTKSVLPEMKACSDLVEEYEGIPRKIGDLIFAYFDDDSLRKNVLHALVAGMEIARKNQDMNATVTQSKIRRYILISSGEAIVGNLGGLDSSIEITALGSPVNFLSRLDEITKSPEISQILNSGDLVVCNQTRTIIQEIGIHLDTQVIDLKQLNLNIRDFPETHKVHRIEPTDSNYRRLQTAFQCLMKDENVTGPIYDLPLAGQI